MFWYKRRCYRSIDYNNINIEQLLQMQKNGAIIVDVRSTQEYNEGHISGAINIPHYEIIKNVKNIIKNKNDNIILYCQMGTRSTEACKNLKRLGYMNLYNLYGGLEMWN